MRNIVLATSNSSKVAELRSLFLEHGVVDWNVLTPKDLGYSSDAREDGSTFDANATQKAVYFSQLTGLPTVADDSGICVESLHGGPGVFSARWAGRCVDSTQVNERLLNLLRESSNRRAKFLCSLAATFPNKSVVLFRGQCPGSIASCQAGSNGFGYDPIFIPDGFADTFASLNSIEKNRISHRSIAFGEFAAWLATL